MKLLGLVVICLILKPFVSFVRRNYHQDNFGFVLKESTIFFHSIKSIHNPAVVLNFSITVFNDTKGISRLNITISSKVDIKEARVAVTVMGKHKPSNREFDKLLLRANIDTCNINKGMLGNFLHSVIRKQLKDHSNYNFDCPIKKGTYYVSNLPPVDDKMLPTYILGIYGAYQVKVSITGKIANNKKLIHIVTVNSFGSVIPN